MLSEKTRPLAAHPLEKIIKIHIKSLELNERCQKEGGTGETFKKSEWRGWKNHIIISRQGVLWLLQLERSEKSKVLQEHFQPKLFPEVLKTFSKSCFEGTVDSRYSVLTNSGKTRFSGFFQITKTKMNFMQRILLRIVDFSILE